MICMFSMLATMLQLFYGTPFRDVDGHSHATTVLLDSVGCCRRSQPCYSCATGHRLGCRWLLTYYSCATAGLRWVLSMVAAMLQLCYGTPLTSAPHAYQTSSTEGKLVISYSLRLGIIGRKPIQTP